MAVVATGASITFTKTLPAGTVTSYIDVSLYVVNSLGVSVRYNTALVNATAIATGSITASGVVFSIEGNYTCTISSESAIDLDTNGVVVTPLVATVVTVTAPLVTAIIL